MFDLRKTNILTKKTTMEEVYTIKNFPVHMGCVDFDEKEDKFVDLTFDICKETGIIQVRQLIDPKWLYITPHNDAVGQTWKNLFIDVVEKSKPYLTDKLNYLEIGGGSGKLAKVFLDKIPEIKNYTIYEPNTLGDFSNPKIKLIKEYFDFNTNIENNDVYIHSHVIEHTSNPCDFIGSISKNCKKGDLLIFAAPNLKATLTRKYTNCLNFEHTFFIIDDYIDIILKNKGFELLSKTNYKDDHSIIYVTKFTGNYHNISFPNLYSQNKTLIQNFIQYHKDIVEKFNNQIDKTNKPVYLFGGHIFSLYLLKFGLKTNKIKCIIDNSPSKEHKRLYGTELMVNNPQVIKSEKECVVILKAAGYQEEIREQLLKLNHNVEIWE